MAKTVVGLIDDPVEAQAAVDDLVESGVPRGDIGLMASERTGDTPPEEHTRTSETASGALKGAGTGAALGGIAGLVVGLTSLAIPGFGPVIAAGPIASALAGAGIGAVAGGLVGALVNVGVPEEDAHYYAEGLRRGGTLITVKTADDVQADTAASILDGHGAVDIHRRAEEWRQAGWSPSSTQSVREDQVLPVAQEELQVGKRETERGGVRVSTRVSEHPVEESVELHEERARVERQRVDRPVQAGDQAFQERSVEIRESAEEPVVAKRARVTEEVRVGKESIERQQTVRDTVRRSDVEVEPVQNETGMMSPYRGPERRRSTSPWTGLERRRAATV